jgi:PiT family inorganic phosphate transporter
VGSVLGYGIIAYGLEGVDLAIISKILLGWMASPLCSLVLASAMYMCLYRFLGGRYYSLQVRRLIAISLILSLCFSGYSFGVNDIANVIGVYTTIMGVEQAWTILLLLAAYGSLGIAIGGLTLGPRVIRTIAYRITKLDPLSGLAAEFSNAIIVYLFSKIPSLVFGYGLPISTSLASNGAIIGAGLAKGGGSLNVRLITTLVSLWILTVPIVAIMSSSLYFVLSRFL